MSNNFSKKPTLALVLLAISALIAAFIEGPANLDSQTKKHAGHQHEEGSHEDHQSPEAQRRMAIFHYNEGNRFSQEKKWDRAIHQYEMALGHETHLLPVYINMSTALMRQKRFPQAMQILDKLKQQAPNMPELHYNLACYYSLTGNVEKGIEALTKAVQEGYRNMKDIDTDPDLEALRKHPDFAAIPRRL